MKFFLKVKAWLLFLLLLVPMLLTLLYPFPDRVGLISFFGLNWLIPVIVIIVWLYSIGMFANSRLPDELKAGTFLYKVGFTIPIIYAVLFLILFLKSVNILQPPVWFIFIHFASTFGMFYGLWFTSKQFTTFTRGEKVKFADYIEPLFLFWFFSIGIWFIQPQVNDAFRRVV